MISWVRFMYSIKVKGVTFGVSFSFLALVGFLSFSAGDMRAQLLMCICCCMFHELGHFAAMLLLGVKAKALILYGGGMLIRRQKGIDSSNSADILILLAGPFANILLAVLLSALGLRNGAGYNLFCAIFNLLPFTFFDGGRIVSLLFSSSTAVEHIRKIFIIILGCLVFLITLLFGLNISLLITFVYISVCEILS